MRKQTKLVAVLSAAALLAVGASMTSFAASKWVLEGEDWVYLDSNGERECNVWRRSNDNYYYLDEDGIMARDTLIDDDGTFYYVDENGVRITNAWKELPNDDGAEVGSEDADDNIPEVLYYYFGSTGKAYTAGGDGKKVRLIEGQYYMFNDDGQMYSGWQTNGDDLYYFGDEKEGWARKGWQYLEPKEDDEDYDELEWYYFGTSGKATKGKSLYISGAYYQFDTNGVMKDGWYTYTATVPTAANGAKAYAGSSGSQASGWVYTSDPDDSDDMYWYYLVTVKENGSTARAIPFNYQVKSDGEAEYSTSDGENGVARAATFKNKTYLFDADGKMLTGFVVINSEGELSNLATSTADCTEVLRFSPEKFGSVGGKDLADGLYYFNESAGSTEGQMQTGRKGITKDGETFYYYFTTNGYACTNEIKSGYLYGPDGKCVVAEAGSSYSVYTLEEDVEGDNLTKGSQVVVSRTGKIKVNGSVKIDGTTYNVSEYVATVKEQ